MPQSSSRKEFSLPEGTHTVVMGVGDANGIMRGKRIPASHWEAVCREGNALSASLFAIDVTCDIWDTPYVNFDNGYPDMHIFPYGEPFALPWEPGVAMVMGRAEDMAHQPVPIDPRNVLLRQLDRAEAMGYEIKIGTELEFFLLDPETMQPKDKGIQVYGLERAAELEHVLGPIRRQINACGIPIEQSNPEYAPGQVEVNIRYDDALIAADRVVIFRSLVKQLALAHGYKATFMAKPFFELSGNGFHAHYSLWKDGVNVFADNGKINATGLSFIAGLQSRMAETSVCGASTVNGYRRRQPDSFCPINASWGIDNRTAGLRVIEGKDSAVRVEKRDAGADCNPYLLLATDIAAGLDGIEQAMTPGPRSDGNAYKDTTLDPLPLDLGDAIARARASDWLKDVMTEIQWEMYLQMCEREWQFYLDDINNRVSAFERDRYMGNF
ncbi:MAG: glutamine synthetase [Alphaproteobacteria bacterium]|nr:glutamine synthetase [Alphaproteobacteria bacterium]